MCPFHPLEHRESARAVAADGKPFLTALGFRRALTHIWASLGSGSNRSFRSDSSDGLLLAIFNQKRGGGREVQTRFSSGEALEPICPSRQWTDASHLAGRGARVEFSVVLLTELLKMAICGAWFSVARWTAGGRSVPALA